MITPVHGFLLAMVVLLSCSHGLAFASGEGPLALSGVRTVPSDAGFRGVALMAQPARERTGGREPSEWPVVFEYAPAGDFANKGRTVPGYWDETVGDSGGYRAVLVGLPDGEYAVRAGVGDGEQRVYSPSRVLRVHGLGAGHLVVSGCVENRRGQRQPGIEVTGESVDDPASSKDVTGDNGRFRIQLEPESTALISGEVPDGGVGTNTREIEVENHDVILEECLLYSERAVTVRLEWGEEPTDLDTHLEGEGIHIHHANKGTLQGPPWVKLDKDDTDGEGPEVLTALELAPGRYRYFVHNYSGERRLGRSNATVELAVKGEIHTYRVPNSHDDKNWEVFTLIVEQGGQITVREP